MKILQLIFIRSLYGSIPRDYWWSAMEIDKTSEGREMTDFSSRDAPKPVNAMRREGDSPKEAELGASSIFPRFLINCVGCCMPGCLTKPREPETEEDPRSPIHAITHEPLAKPKEHDSGEDEEVHSDSSTDPLPVSMRSRGMQLRRRQGMSPPRPSQAPRIVSYITGLMQRSREELEDPRGNSPSITGPPVISMEHLHSPVISPMIVQNSQENVYQKSSDVSRETAPSTDAHAPESTESTSTTTPESTSSVEPTTISSTVTTTPITTELSDFVFVGDVLAAESDDEDYFVVNGDSD